MSLSPSPRQNHILASLPDEEYTRLLPFLERVHMPLGQVIYEPNTKIRKLYFPVDSIIARMYELESGSSRQVSMIGNEGISDMFFYKTVAARLPRSLCRMPVTVTVLTQVFSKRNLIQEACCSTRCYASIKPYFFRRSRAR